MIGVPNFTIIEQLGATPHSVVYWARKDGRPAGIRHFKSPEDDRAFTGGDRP